jgi:CBS domain-containing protein
MPFTQLHSTPVSEVLKRLQSSKQKLVSVLSKQSVEECLQLMSVHNITALAVASADTGKYTGIVNLFDILFFLVLCAFPDTGATAEQLNKKAIEKMAAPVGEILGLEDVERESFRLWEFAETDPMSKLLDALSKGVHRVLVQTAAGPVLLSQTDVVKYVHLVFGKEVEMDRKLKELKLVPSRPFGKSGQNTVLAVVGTTALSAYKKMAKEGVTAIPVVDKNNQVVATLSASELRGIAPAHLHDLLLPVEKFVEARAASTKHHHASQITVDAEKGTLRDVIVKLGDAKVHHVWVTQSDGKLSGVVSMTDLMSKFSPYDYLV